MSNTSPMPPAMVELLGNLDNAAGPLEVLVPMAKMILGIAESGFKFGTRVAPHWEPMVTAVIKNLETYILGCRAGLEQFAVLEAQKGYAQMAMFFKEAGLDLEALKGIIIARMAAAQADLDYFSVRRTPSMTHGD